MSDFFQKFPKFSGILILGLAGFAVYTSLPKAAENLSPQGKNTRYTEHYGLLTDRKNGNIYGVIDGKNGEKRFVKMDKVSERQVRREKEQAEEAARKKKAAEKAKNQPKPAVVYVSKKKDDVRSERIFSRDGSFKQFNFNAKIKYRIYEQSMLYRLAVTHPVSQVKTEAGTLEKAKCLTRKEEKSLLSLRDQKENGNQLRLRFVDGNDFWLKDATIPLWKGAANNLKTTVIDSYTKDECGRINTLVFHGRLRGFTMPDYSWVEDGKLLFDDVQFLTVQEQNLAESSGESEKKKKKKKKNRFDD